MGASAFQPGLATHRVVTIPAGLEGDARARFAAKVAAAVRQQAALAAESVGVLAVGEDLIHNGDRILIPHEPASPLNPAVLESADSRPSIDELWWWSWATSDALDRAAAGGIVHGGVQSGALYCDETGCVKLGDFGIAAIYESVCGTELRRQVHCDPRIGEVDGRASSGTWALLDEDAGRDYGWIAPYFAHELLDGRQRLNPKSDQFALGTLLFLLATGTHPYAASLADPTLTMYVHLDPYEVRDERADWTDVFERADQNLSTSDDQRILEWAAFVRTLLASDPAQRFGPGAASRAAADVVPAAWAEAAAAMRTAEAALEEGDAERAVELARPWVDHAELPPAWRERLGEWYRRTEERKELIARQRKLRLRLREGQEALDLMSLDEAEQIANEVAGAAEIDDELRRQCDELLAGCAEQRAFIESGADDLAKAYLESARECLEQERLREARQLLEGVLGDPATPAARAKQARRQLAEVELIEQRIENQTRVLNEADADLRATRYDEARRRLEALLAQAEVSEKIAAQARALLDEAVRSQQLFEQYQGAFDRAADAWRRADAEALASEIESVDAAFANPTIQEARGRWAQRLETLHAARKQRDAARAAFDEDRIADALRAAEDAAQIDGAPETLARELQELADRCRRILAERRAALIAEAEQALDDAQNAWRESDAAKLRERIEAFPDGVDDAELLARRDALIARVEPLEAALAARKEAQQALDNESLEAALEALRRGVALAEQIPQSLAAELRSLAESCEQRLEQRRRERIAAACEALDQARADFSNAQAEPAAKRIREQVLSVAEIDDETRAQAEQLLADCELAQEVSQTLDAAERHIADDEFDAADGLLNPLSPSGLPAVIAERIDALRRTSGQRRAAFVAQREAELAAQLDEADASLANGDLDGAETVVAGVESSPHATSEIIGRAESIRAAVAEQRDLLATIQEVERLTVEPTFDPAPAAARLETLSAELPSWLAPRVESLRDVIRRREDKIRRQRSQLVVSLFEAAELAIDECDLERAVRKLGEVTSGIDLDDSFAKRRDGLLERIAELRPLVERVEQLERRFEAGEIAPVHREAMSLKEDDSLPAALAERVANVLAGTSDHIRAHRERLDATLAELADELQTRGRRARRFEDRCETIASDELATKAQRKYAGDLREQYLALPAPKRDWRPIFIAGGAAAAALMVVLGLYLSGVFGAKNGADSADSRTARVTTSHETASAPAVVNRDGDRSTAERNRESETLEKPPAVADLTPTITAALDRLRREFEQQRASLTQTDRITPQWRLTFDPPDAMPTTLWAHRADSNERVELGRADDTAALAALHANPLPAATIDRLFPLDVEKVRARKAAQRRATLARRIEEELARLQAELDAAIPKRASAGRVLLEWQPQSPEEPLPGRLTARVAESDAALDLAEAASLEALASLHVSPDWVSRIYPPPTAAELALTYAQAVREALGDDEVAVEVSADDAATLTAQARWRGRNLLALPNLRADLNAGRIDPPARIAAEYFTLQIDALRAILDDDAPLRVELDPRYDDRLRLVNPAESAEIESVDASERSVRIAAAARIDDDSRTEATFALTGTLRGDVLDAHESRDAFEQYLAGLQAVARDAALEEARRASQTPPDLIWTWASTEAEAPRLLVSSESGALRVEATAKWNPDSLRYEIDADAIAAAIIDAIADSTASPAIVQEITTQAEETRRSLADAGATFLQRCAVRSVRPSGAFDAERWRQEYAVLIAPPDAASDEVLEAPATARWESGGVVVSVDATVRDSLRRQLAERADDPDYRRRRLGRALRAFAAAEGLNADKLQATSQGDVARVELPNDSTTETVEWRWDRAALEYRGPRRIARAPSPPANPPRNSTPPPPHSTPRPAAIRLPDLAARRDVSPNELADALAFATRQKLARLGGGAAYAASSALSGVDGIQRLLGVSRAIRRQVAADPARDPFPTVFVEFFIAEDGVYRLSWSAASAGGDDFDSVQATRIERVLTRGELAAIGSPEAFRSRYTEDAELGERLLGSALGDPLTGVAGSFGVAIAPDGPLWLTRWEQVRFDRRRTSNIDDRGLSDAGRVETLREALRAQRTRRDRNPWRRGGVWVMPTLAGEWRGGGASLRLNLGEIARGARPGVAVFKRYASSGIVLAAIEDPTSRRNDWEWPAWIKSANRTDLGTSFWDRDWAEDGYHPGKTRALAIVLAP